MICGANHGSAPKQRWNKRLGRFGRLSFMSRWSGPCGNLRDNSAGLNKPFGRGERCIISGASVSYPAFNDTVEVSRLMHLRLTSVSFVGVGNAVLTRIQ